MRALGEDKRLWDAGYMLLKTVTPPTHYLFKEVDRLKTPATTTAAKAPGLGLFSTFEKILGKPGK